MHYLDPLPSPSDVRLLSASTNSLTFKWSSVSTNCSAVHYIIESDCGSCPNTASLTSVDCSIMPISTSRSCAFAVKSVVCGNIIGNSSNRVFVTLKGKANVILKLKVHLLKAIGFINYCAPIIIPVHAYVILI